MLSIHSKMLFSIFASTKLKKEVEKRNFTHQYGTKKAGSETMIHMFQQIITQKRDFDIFSADAIKAFYNLNRDIAMRKLKTECPEFYNLFPETRPVQKRINLHCNLRHQNLLHERESLPAQLQS